MYTTVRICALAAVLGSTLTAAEDTAEKTLRFAHLSDPQSIMEAATVMRSVGEIRQLQVDASKRVVTMRGTAAQVALADWIFGQLDQPIGAQLPPILAYQMAGTPEGVARIFHAHTETVQSLQELTTMIRSVCEIRRAFTFNAARAMVMRGTAEEISRAEWLFREVDQNLRSQQEFRAPGDDVLRVFYLDQTKTPAEFLENAASIRESTRILRAFTYNASRALALRGTAAQIAEAERLIDQKELRLRVQ